MAADPSVLTHFERLVRVALRLGHSRDEAEDLAQECMLVFSSGNYRGESSVETWLYRVLWNKHVDLLRSRKLALPTPAAEKDGPPSGLERTEMLDRIREALHELEEMPKAVLVLRYFEGVACADIARILDRPVGTVKADCFRALERLHDVLDRKYGRETVKEWL